MDEPAASDRTEQERVRHDKRQRMLDAGLDPYPVVVERTHSLREVRRAFEDAGLEPGASTGQRVAVAGRVIFWRDTGKLCFLRLREGDGTELQAMFSERDLGPAAFADLKAYMDIGDFVAVQGEVVVSRRGELSVQADRWEMAAKSLRPLPGEHWQLTDEARVRYRYLDMIQRPEARDLVRAKATVLRSLRETLHEQGYVEVETPVLQLTNGGAAARPFRTHLNVFDQEMLLRIALELDLKRAMVGGVERVFEIGKTFRNEGIDSTHAAEFLMLEAYQAYGDYETMMELVRDLVLGAARALGRTVITARDGSSVDLEGPWRRAALLDLVGEAVGEPVGLDTDVGTLRRHAAAHDVEVEPSWSAAQVLVELYEQRVEETLLHPTFVCDYPAELKPLAKPRAGSPGLNEAFDLVAGGVELVTAFTELNDPVLQRERLEEQARKAVAGNPEANDLDEVFLRALEHGMPPAGGMGIGVDRLLMLLTGAGIRETILFPLLRPQS